MRGLHLRKTLLFVLTLFLCPYSVWGVPRVVCLYLCEDPTPDGYTLRLGANSSTFQVGGIEFKREPSIQDLRFPIVPYYKPESLGAQVFTQIIFDWEFESQESLFGPKQKGETVFLEGRETLVKLFDKDKYGILGMETQASDWRFQLSSVSSFIIFGKSFGVRIFEHGKLVGSAFSLGVVGALYSASMSINLCRNVEIDSSDTPEFEQASKTCIDSLMLYETQSNAPELGNSTRAWGAGIGGYARYAFYESYESSSVFKFLDFQLISLIVRNLDFKGGASFPFRVTRWAVDLFSITYSF